MNKSTFEWWDRHIRIHGTWLSLYDLDLLLEPRSRFSSHVQLLLLSCHLFLCKWPLLCLIMKAFIYSFLSFKFKSTWHLCIWFASLSPLPTWTATCTTTNTNITHTSLAKLQYRSVDKFNSTTMHVWNPSLSPPSNAEQCSVIVSEAHIMMCSVYSKVLCVSWCIIFMLIDAT